MKIRNQEYPWLVWTRETRTMECERCGAKEQLPPLPCQIGEMAGMDEFLVRHKRQCAGTKLKESK